MLPSQTALFYGSMWLGIFQQCRHFSLCSLVHHWLKHDLFGRSTFDSCYLVPVGSQNLQAQVKWFSRFYPRPVLAFGYCRCLRLSVCPSVRPSVVDKAFKGGHNKYIQITSKTARWFHSKKNESFTKEDIFSMIDLVIDHSFLISEVPGERKRNTDFRREFINYVHAQILAAWDVTRHIFAEPTSTRLTQYERRDNITHLQTEVWAH